MKILIYCQHVLGLGHYFRTLEICRALNQHEITIIAGGPPIDTVIPNHVREIRLPPLRMDSNFNGLLAENTAISVDQMKKHRRQMLFGLYKSEAPDLLITELYPFGRRAFAFEIDPLLKGIHTGILKPAVVVCSLRDILVGRRKYTPAYESKVVNLLNRYYDALLIHADPLLLKLDRTFSRLNDLTIPAVYTGFVTPQPPPRARQTIRRQLNIDENERLIVASLGGGRVGEPLLNAVIQAVLQIKNERPVSLAAFTGPFMPPEVYEGLKQYAGGPIRVERFSSDFLSYLAAADLSVSMAGYNTCMNILSARVPALVWPFSQNREQRIRAERLAEIGALEVLHDDDLAPKRLSAIMNESLSHNRRACRPVDIAGAEKTAQWIQRAGLCSARE